MSYGINHFPRYLSWRVLGVSARKRIYFTLAGVDIAASMRAKGRRHRKRRYRSDS